MSETSDTNFGRQVYGAGISVQTGGGSVVGTIIGSSGSRIDKQNIQVIQDASEKRQNLAEAAAEIQQLLKQLSYTYPISTNREKMAFVAEAVDQIEQNPTLKGKVINALKVGGTEAFKEAINHPIVNILMATIEGWKEA